MYSTLNYINVMFYFLSIKYIIDKFKHSIEDLFFRYILIFITYLKPYEDLCSKLVNSNNLLYVCEYFKYFFLDSEQKRGIPILNFIMMVFICIYKYIFF